MTRSAPHFRHVATLSAEPTVVITRPPIALTICTTIEPTPPVPPLTNTVSPLLSPAHRNRPRWAVIPTNAPAAATLSSTPAGVGESHSALTQAYSANVPCRPSNPWLDPQTRSPGFSAVTPGP